MLLTPRINALIWKVVLLPMEPKRTHFSKRMEEIGNDLPDNDLTILKTERLEKGLSVLDLTNSNPTQLELDFPWSSILEELDFHAFSDYSPDPKGLTTARKAISETIYSSDLSENLILTSGSSESLSYLLKLLTNPGDSILLPTPGYPLFPFIANLESVEFVEYPLFFEEKSNQWEYSIESMQKMIRKNTKAVLIVTPNNPTGSILSKQEWEKWEAWSIETQIPLIVDTVFSDFILNKEKELDTSFVPTKSKAPVFVLNGISKMLFLPQWKLAWILVLGEKEFQQTAIRSLEFISDTYLSVNSFIQKKIPELLVWKSMIQNQWKRRISRNLYLCKSFDWKSIQLSFQFGNAGYYGYFEIGDRDSEKFCEILLKETGILLHPGSLFNFPDEKERVIFSLVVDEILLEDGLQKLFKFCLEGKEVLAKFGASL